MSSASPTRARRRRTQRRQARARTRESARTAPQPPPAGRSGFIVAPLYDSICFIGAPLLALALGIAINETVLTRHRVALFDYGYPAAGMFMGSFIFAHLVAVVFRSHANPVVFRTHPLRFTAVPLVLLTAMTASLWVTVAVSVLATFWDVYHSGLQTFGLGRIYDARRGNDPEVGRRLDWWLNLLLYVGPILAGATLMDHVGDFHEFEAVGSVFFTSIPAAVESRARLLTWGVLGVGIPFLVFYVWSYWRLHRQGYRISPQKVALLAGTGLCSIYTWGFNSFGQAFFIMNFFHALQYFAIVWWSEQRNLVSLFRLKGLRWGRPAALFLLLLLTFAFGFWAEVFVDGGGMGMRLVLVVSIMHFWYDGFIWSVRKRQV